MGSRSGFLMLKDCTNRARPLMDYRTLDGTRGSTGNSRLPKVLTDETSFDYTRFQQTPPDAPLPGLAECVNRPSISCRRFHPRGFLAHGRWHSLQEAHLGERNRAGQLHPEAHEQLNDDVLREKSRHLSKRRVEERRNKASTRHPQRHMPTELPRF